MNEQNHITTGQLFPNLTKEELQEAQENLEQYLALVVRIYQRQQTQGFDQ